MHESDDAEMLQLAARSNGPRIATARLGIIGGGQLARMTALSARQLGCDVAVLERNSYSPAAALATHNLVGDWENPEALLKLAALVDVVTLENEFVSADALEVIERSGRRLLPSTATLRRVQDKLIQKQTLAAAGLPVAPFAAVERAEDLPRVAKEFGWPFVLKTRRNGYDGKGNFTLRTAADIPAAWQALGGDRNTLYAEAFCPFVRELAVIITRDAAGNAVAYPVVETVQRGHICHLVKAPADVPAAIAERAVGIAHRAIAAIDGVGSFGVELFLTAAGEVLVNELAPRVHNSGHYTIEACVCSQFENHIRAVLGWPLGSSAMVSPAAAMVNLLGVGKGPGAPQGLPRALAVPGAHVHVYGKAVSGAGRKMGHVTALGETVEQAVATAERAAREIIFGVES